MFLTHPNIKDLRILRIYSNSIENKYCYGPHSCKVTAIVNILLTTYNHIIRCIVSLVLIKGVGKVMNSSPYM